MVSDSIYSAQPPQASLTTVTHIISCDVTLLLFYSLIRIPKFQSKTPPVTIPFACTPYSLSPSITISPQPHSLALSPTPNPWIQTPLTQPPALNDLLPTPVPVYHLGLFREKVSLQPVEYYNNLPFHRSELSPASPASLNPTTNTAAASLAVLLDPVIATGATAEAAIQLLRDWGVKKVIMLSLLASEEGVKRAAGTWSEVEVWVGGIDKGVDEKGMIVPGIGDIGDRLFVAIGK